MDRTILVGPKIKEGGQLLRSLDKAGFQVTAALWLYESEPDRWRLMIASPLVDSKGPKAAYDRIQSSIETSKVGDSLALSEISAVGPKDPVIKALRMAVHTGPGISGIRFSRNTINNIFIEDAYIYRVE